MPREILIDHLLKTFELPVIELNNYFESFGYSHSSVEDGGIMYSHRNLERDGIFSLVMENSKITYCTCKVRNDLDIELLAKIAIDNYNFTYIETDGQVIVLDKEEFRLLIIKQTSKSVLLTTMTLGKRNAPFGFKDIISVEMQPPPAL
jgi:hypothetical protein